MIKTKQMCKHAVKKLPFLIKYVPDWYKTPQMCDQVRQGNDEMLMFIPYFYKDEKCVIMLIIMLMQ